MPSPSRSSSRRSRCSQYAGSKRSRSNVPSSFRTNGYRSGSLLLNVYDFGKRHIRIFVNGDAARVSSVCSCRASGWWVHAYEVVPIGRYRVPSAYRKWNSSATRTGPCDGPSSTVTLPVSPSRDRALLVVSQRHSPTEGGRNRTRWSPPPAAKPSTSALAPSGPKKRAVSSTSVKGLPCDGPANRISRRSQRLPVVGAVTAAEATGTSADS